MQHQGLEFRKFWLCILILIGALCFSFYNMRTIGRVFRDLFQKEVTYDSIEEMLRESTLKYKEKFYPKEIGDGVLTISSNQLLEKHILKKEDLITKNQDVCKGYGKVYRNENGDIEIRSFIHCQQYETKGYESWRIGE